MSSLVSDLFGNHEIKSDKLEMTTPDLSILSLLLVQGWIEIMSLWISGKSELRGGKRALILSNVVFRSLLSDAIALSSRGRMYLLVANSR
jgi:hypothetical protein